MSANKRRIQETDEGNLVGNLRGEVGEAITTWALWRIYRIHELRSQTPDIADDLANVGLRLLGVVVDRLRDDLTARLSELGETKTGQLTFHFLAQKRPEFSDLSETFTRFVVSSGIRDKRHRDISHKELPPQWKDHRNRYVYDRVLTRGTALALRTMKAIDRRLIGPESPYLWRIMRTRRYEPMTPPSSGYLIMLILPYRWRFANAFGLSQRRAMPNVRCCCRWSYGTRRGTRCARVHGASLLDPPQQNASRLGGRIPDAGAK